MQARTYRTLDAFDASIKQLRAYVDALEAQARNETAKKGEN